MLHPPNRPGVEIPRPNPSKPLIPGGMKMTKSDYAEKWRAHALECSRRALQAERTLAALVALVESTGRGETTVDTLCRVVGIMTEGAE